MSAFRIGIVAGEESGDQLGAGIIAALKKHYPQAIFEGVGGARMQALGFRSLFPMERLAVMGLVEPLKRLPELWSIRRQLIRHFLATRPVLVLGIDAPDFNLGLELKVRQAGIATAHYVSPSVWAWRQGRIHKIARAVDLMLTLLPFEAQFYRQHNVPVVFVGHPMADELPLTPNPIAARRALGLLVDGPLLALLPGSRASEVALLGPLFIQVARRCLEAVPDLQLVLPAANSARRRQIDIQLQGVDLPIRVIDGQSHLAMEAATAVLLASGTTALEAMLLKKPMVVSYKTGWLSHAILSRMLKVPYVSLPNLLAGRALVPELLQGQATVTNIATQVLQCLGDEGHRATLVEEFDKFHRQLRCNGSAVAAEALIGLIESRG